MVSLLFEGGCRLDLDRSRRLHPNEHGGPIRSSRRGRYAARQSTRHGRQSHRRRENTAPSGLLPGPRRHGVPADFAVCDTADASGQKLPAPGRSGRVARLGERDTAPD